MERSIDMKKIIWLFGALLLFATACENLTLRSAEQESFELASDQTGQSYEISILLPPNYDETASYPSVYLLDGHWHYPHVAADAQQLMEKGEIDDVIIVGIAFAGIDEKTLGGFAEISRLRIDDLTFPKNREVDTLGGEAFAFRAFIKDDLIPEVEARYATSADDWTLMGHSLGGYFGFWEMFTYPDSSLFVNIEAGSPALWWADGALLEKENEIFEAGTPLPFDLHTTMGTVESVTWNAFFDEMEDRINDNNHPGLRSVFERYPRGHAANAEVGFRAGLKYFFGK